MGVGLLGGSVGLACRAAGFGARRVGIGRRRSSLDRARRRGAIDEATLSFARGLRGTGLVVLATPIGQFADTMEKMAPHLEPGTVITDVGSTKAEVVALAKDILPSHCAFVGSHPMAGGEKTGVEFARADLFAGAACCVTPTPQSSRSAVRLVCAFWRALGARVSRLTPARHDEMLARVSHLPHAVAAMLIVVAGDSLDAAGPGLADTTRIASGDPAAWRDIFGTNRRSMLGAVDALTAALRRFRQLLEADDCDGVEKFLADAKRTRDRWIARQAARKEWPQ